MNIEIEFERECYKCYGASSFMPDRPCAACGNRGKVPTELGDALLEFLERWGIKPITKEASDNDRQDDNSNLR